MKTLIELGQDIADALAEVEATNEAAAEDPHSLAIVELHKALNKLRKHSGIALGETSGPGVIAFSADPNKGE